ncbi:alpha/beta fold hydrolase [Mycolicibacterium sp. CH28]|uniref:alpha/beta hydrolase n=1 Tax=Mycolicibacterium sp. CH28 TaxID=2512237 RepID=UPI00108193A7|nr:alpha/beta fold hydrolase [Mycolicibacterium sp. CH28]TGD89025.1 alpha/beta fold hydrolase [Mycolicibacterium sp. CH28]
MLELIEKGQISENHPRTILFVHGAWHGGWCWDENFLDFFAARGFHVLAPSLRGHGSSPADKPLRLCSIWDFVEDVASVVQTLPAAPIMVGHSMGGFVVQKYLEAHHSPAGILIASTPPRGQLGSLLRSMRQHPWRSSKFGFTGRPADLYKSPAQARELFFGDKASDSLVTTIAARLQPDSTRAIMFDMVVGNLIDTRKIRTPLMILGGEKDQIYSPHEVAETARAYRTEPVLIPGMGHELMIEPGWQTVALQIESWLCQRGL